VKWAIAAGTPVGLFLPVLILSGIALGVIGPFIEALLRTVYHRDEAFQLLLTFALVLMFQDVLRFFWGANPQELGNLSMGYGKLAIGAVQVPTYNVLVILASILIALGIGALLQRTRYGRILRATAENREMSQALGVNVRWMYSIVFTLGTILGTVGGALVVPTAAASLDMPVELVVEAFAVVVIGGLGSMRGALIGALIVGLMRALAIRYYAELEMLAIYLVVIAVLIARPMGLHGKSIE
jgi:branched-chain amino acid transport system permease protein